MDTSLFWLRVAAVLYSFGLAHSTLVLVRRSAPLLPAALTAFAVGAILHFVSLTERGLAAHRLPIGNYYESVSFCAFVVAVVFLFVYWRYQFSSAAVAVFPLVSVMTVIATLETPVGGWANAEVRGWWLAVHVMLILLGYAGMVITALASVFYLVQEKRLKKKKLPAAGVSRWLDRLPPLHTLDLLTSRAMGFGFAFVTLGLVVGSTWAFIESGHRWLGETRITFAFVTWAFYLLMVFLRAAAGWRGRKAALLAITVLGCSALTWAAHVGLRDVLAR
jgi:ABC-type uncharacterized transport system permease subunit